MSPGEAKPQSRTCRWLHPSVSASTSFSRTVRLAKQGLPVLRGRAGLRASSSGKWLTAYIYLPLVHPLVVADDTLHVPPTLERSSGHLCRARGTNKNALLRRLSYVRARARLLKLIRANAHRTQNSIGLTKSKVARTQINVTSTGQDKIVFGFC